MVPWQDNGQRHPHNVTLLRLTEPAFGSPPVPQPDNRTRMLRWAVADVVAFFETKDAKALGETLAANSVEGADLLRFTEESLKIDLKLNTIAARKICHLRDGYLS